MRISVDRSICEGFGQCYTVDPELFPLDDDGYSAVGQDKQVPADEEEVARQGVLICPVEALSLHED